MSGASPMTKAARHARIAGILARVPVRSQDELAAALAEAGVQVTQATLSRDLEELGAVRLRGADGGLVYSLPHPADMPGGLPAPGPGGTPEASGRLARIAAELLTSAEASANLVVLRTPAGAAQFFASALDHANWPSILGTVAGDDTVLVVTRDPAGGAEVAAQLLRLAERREPVN
ncbi:MAG TPA: arginine repressor [Streptosporangiaceae bacterium]|nr:arginine repressor [Streptosporangiaceae bacterium]